MNLENYLNLDSWVEQLNAVVAKTLTSRYQAALASWCRYFQAEGLADGRNEDSASENAQDQFNLAPVMHELRMRNQVIYVDPPLEMTQTLWIKQCQRILGEC